MVSTDPPYYDNIGYADLSDFYVWLRRSIFNIYPKLFQLLLFQKWELATPYRFKGDKEKAKVFLKMVYVKYLITK